MTPRRNRLLAVLGAVVVVALVVGLLVWQPWSSTDGNGSRSASGGGATDLTVTAAAPSPDAVRSATAAPVHVDAAVRDEIAQKGSTRVLVSLDVSPTGTDAERAAQVRAAIDGLVASLPAGSVSNVDAQNMVIPVAIFDVTAAGVDALQRRAIVIAVDADARRSVIQEAGEADIAATMDAAVKAQGGTSPSLNTPAAANTSTDQIGAPQAWAAGWRGAGGVVAVLDSGVQSNHPYLAAGSGSKVIGEACFVTPGGSWGSPCPGNVSMGINDAPLPGSGQPCGVTACSHGTHVAGIAAGGDGVTDGATASGVAPDARLIAVQVFATNGASIGASDSDIIHAINWLYNNRAAFPGLAAVNLSLGSGMYTGYCDVEDWFYKAAFDLLGTVGIVVAVASGNNGYPNSGSGGLPAVSSPACVSTAVTVGAVDEIDHTTNYSNDGPQLDLMAPGSSIYSSVPGSVMAYKTGTSMATPAVAGAIALLRQPDAATAVANLKATGPDVNASGIHTPRIAVGAAVTALPSTVSGITVDVQGSQATVSWNAPGYTGTSSLTGYRVEGGGATCAPVITSCVLSGVAADTRTFTVRAVNSFGAGSVATATLPDRPTNVSVDLQGSQAAVNWTSPIDVGSSSLAGGRVDSSPGTAYCVTLAGPSCTVYGLDPSAVSFTVRSRSAVGLGLATTVVLPGAPGSVSAQVQPGHGDVSWSSPVNVGSSAIVGYSVVASPGGAMCATMGATSCAVRGLLQGTSYTFTVRAINDIGEGLPATSSSTLVAAPGPMMTFDPERFMDTRATGSTVDGTGAAGGAFGGGEWRTLQITGRGSVPATGVGAVAVNITAVNPAPSLASGWLAVAPTRVPSVPTTSNLNFVAGQTVANMAIVAVSPSGTIEVFNKNGTSQVLIDVLGWLPDASAFTGLAPLRLLDTRATGTTFDGESQQGGAVVNEATVTVKVSDRAGVPASAGAVVVNVTAVGPTATGFVTAYPTDVTRPTSSNLNFTAGRTAANLVLTKVAADDTITLYVKFPGGVPADSVNLLVDVMGWFPATGSFTGLTPARLMDTRSNGLTIDGVSQREGALQNGATRSVQVLGRGGVPASGVSAVAVNVTIASPTANGFATVYPRSSPSATPPTASNINFAAGRVVPNMVTADVAPDGTIAVYVKFPGGAPADSANVLVDVLGWFP